MTCRERASGRVRRPARPGCRCHAWSNSWNRARRKLIGIAVISRMRKSGSGRGGRRGAEGPPAPPRRSPWPLWPPLPACATPIIRAGQHTTLPDAIATSSRQISPPGHPDRSATASCSRYCCAERQFPT